MAILDQEFPEGGPITAGSLTFYGTNLVGQIVELSAFIGFYGAYAPRLTGNIYYTWTNTDSPAWFESFVDVEHPADMMVLKFFVIRRPVYYSVTFIDGDTDEEIVETLDFSCINHGGQTTVWNNQPNGFDIELPSPEDVRVPGFIGREMQSSYSCRFSAVGYLDAVDDFEATAGTQRDVTVLIWRPARLVEGYVYSQLPNASRVPLEGAIVTVSSWFGGDDLIEWGQRYQPLPTDEQGYYYFRLVLPAQPFSFTACYPDFECFTKTIPFEYTIPNPITEETYDLIVGEEYKDFYLDPIIIEKRDETYDEVQYEAEAEGSLKFAALRSFDNLIKKLEGEKKKL